MFWKVFLPNTILYLRLNDNIRVRRTTTKVTLLDVIGDGWSTDTMFTFRTGAVVVKLLPVMVQNHRRHDLWLSVLQRLLDHLEHTVPLLVRLQQEDDLDLCRIVPFDGVDGDGDVGDRGYVAVMGLVGLLLDHPWTSWPPCDPVDVEVSILTMKTFASLTSWTWSRRRQLWFQFLNLTNNKLSNSFVNWATAIFVSHSEKQSLILKPWITMFHFTKFCSITETIQWRLSFLDEKHSLIVTRLQLWISYDKHWTDSDSVSEEGGLTLPGLSAGLATHWRHPPHQTYFLTINIQVIMITGKMISRRHCGWCKSASMAKFCPSSVCEPVLAAPS